VFQHRNLNPVLVLLHKGKRDKFINRGIGAERQNIELSGKFHAASELKSFAIIEALYHAVISQPNPLSF